MKHHIGGPVDYGLLSQMHRPQDDGLAAEARRLHGQGLSPQDIAQALRVHRVQVEGWLVDSAIQARAVRRCGELLKRVGNDAGGRPKDNHDGTVTVTRTQAAAQAGLSERQKVTALRVASVPEAEFAAGNNA